MSKNANVQFQICQDMIHGRAAFLSLLEVFGDCRVDRIPLVSCHGFILNYRQLIIISLHRAHRFVCLGFCPAQTARLFCAVDSDPSLGFDRLKCRPKEQLHLFIDRHEGFVDFPACATEIPVIAMLTKQPHINFSSFPAPCLLYSFLLCIFQARNNLSKASKSFAAYYNFEVRKCHIFVRWAVGCFSAVIVIIR